MIRSPPTLSQDPLRVTLTSQQTYGPFLYALQQWSSFNGAEIGIAPATGTPPPLLNPPGPAPSETDLQLNPNTQLETTHLKYARVALWPTNSTVDKFKQPLTPEGARDFREDPATPPSNATTTTRSSAYAKKTTQYVCTYLPTLTPPALPDYTNTQIGSHGPHRILPHTLDPTHYFK